MAGVSVAAAAPVQEWECKLFQALAELLFWRGQVGDGKPAAAQTHCIKNGFLGLACNLEDRVFVACVNGALGSALSTILANGVSQPLGGRGRWSSCSRST